MPHLKTIWMSVSPDLHAERQTVWVLARILTAPNSLAVCCGPARQMMRDCFNLLNPTGYMMHQQFNI
jgi:hypothetical protein